MAAPTTLTSKGQVTVPRQIRERLGPKSGDTLAFTTLSDWSKRRPQPRSLS